MRISRLAIFLVLVATRVQLILAQRDLSIGNQDGNPSLASRGNFTTSYTSVANTDDVTTYDEQGSDVGLVTPKEQCKPGKRPDPADCSKYFWCVEKPAGTLAEYHHDCPGDLVYSPHAYTCVSSSSYACVQKRQYPYPPPVWPPPVWPPTPVWPPPPPVWPPPPPSLPTTTTTTTQAPPTCTGAGFMCRSDTTFALCAATGFPFEPNLSCPQDYFCNAKCWFPCLQFIPSC